MSDIVIKVENLWKEYRLGTINHGTLSHDLQSWWAKLRGQEDPNSLITAHNQEPRTRRQPVLNPHFFAINDVSFEVKQGEALGIIGRNGAGKSTLLKILSSITAPTRGEVKIKGRVASLLEVGTGFHPELTGRENIYLNGAILGMRRLEIRRKFEEIVAFAEVERFIDTPVKRYSSGMYVRLAFAVAAHLEPEILIVDEVLAVGDAQFQKKCLGKMEEVGKEGRTVLFVSHNMAAVSNLCNVGVVLDKGTMTFHGEIIKSIDYYLGSFLERIDTKDLSLRLDRTGEGHLRITNLEIKDQSGNGNIPILTGTQLYFGVDYKSHTEMNNPRVIIGIYDLMNVGVTRFDTDIAGNLPSVLPESGRIVCRTEGFPLAPGRYYVNIAILTNGVMQDYLLGAAFLDIHESDYFNTGKTFNENDSKLVKVLVRHKWELES